MKYSQHWKKEMDLLPMFLKHYCIHYKRWKKCINTPHKSNTYIDILEKDCLHVDNIFTMYYNSYSKLNCFLKIIDKSLLLRFAILNKTTVYKICKRLDKLVNPSPNALQWMNMVQTKLKYNFLGGYMLTSLSIKLPIECDICFHNVNHIAVSKCGHYMCIECLEDMYKMRGKKGTFQNLVDSFYSEHKLTCCPFCRYNQPFTKIEFVPKHTGIKKKLIH